MQMQNRRAEIINARFSTESCYPLAATTGVACPEFRQSYDASLLSIY
jgi:hypothetical protein